MAVAVLCWMWVGVGMEWVRVEWMECPLCHQGVLHV